MEFKLGVRDRLLLLGILPVEGDLTAIRIVRELREGLSFTEAEHDDLQMKQLDGAIQWQEGAIPDKTLDIGPKAAAFIRDALGELDKAKKLRTEHLPLIELFEYEAER